MVIDSLLDGQRIVAESPNGVELEKLADYIRKILADYGKPCNISIVQPRQDVLHYQLTAKIPEEFL